MEVAGKWLFDPSTLQWLKTKGRKHLGTVQLPQEVRGKYPALEEALNVMNKVAGRIQRERWEVEQSQLAWAGAAMCSICMEYRHVEANCHEREEDWDTDLQWCTNCLCYGHEEDRCLETKTWTWSGRSPSVHHPRGGSPRVHRPRGGRTSIHSPSRGLPATPTSSAMGGITATPTFTTTCCSRLHH
ncbi:UNVERIFIED_CONTAM: hypothetical protein FKN15_042786 [Acipenser sinensis]